MMGMFGKGMAQANQPLYGQAQVGSYLSNLNDLANSSIGNLRSNLARTGGINSGALSSGITGIDIARQGQAGNFMAQLPMLNRQAALQGAQTYGGLGNQLLSLAPRTTTQSGQSSGQNRSQTVQDPSMLSMIGQGLGIAGGFMGMPFLGGFGGGGGMNNSSGFAPNWDMSSAPWSGSTLWNQPGGPG
jgi:hypothetical protein